MDLDLNITVELDGKQVNANDLLEIDEADLCTEYAAQAARFAWVAVLKAEAKLRWAEAERTRKEDEALAFKEYKADVSASGKSVTDGYASQLVQADENCNDLRMNENEAEYRYRVLEALSSALDMRATMLISMGADLRAERGQTGMKVLEDPASSLKDALSTRRK